MKRQSRGRDLDPEVAPGRAVLGYIGLDEIAAPDPAAGSRRPRARRPSAPRPVRPVPPTAGGDRPSTWRSPAGAGDEAAEPPDFDTAQAEAGGGPHTPLSGAGAGRGLVQDGRGPGRGHDPGGHGAGARHRGGAGGGDRPRARRGG